MKDIAKLLRQDLKKNFKGFKFSVTTDHNSISVVLLASPLVFTQTEFGVNHYYLDRVENDKLRETFVKINELLDGYRPVSTLVEDADYGSVPNYYKTFAVGKWNKPYTTVA